MAAEMITGTSYVDEVQMQGWYDYGVTGVNGSGEGDLAMAPEAVYTGPPEYEEIPYDWFEINQIGVNTGINGDDQNLGPFDMGIAFPWYDNVVHSSVRICSNGWISFTSTSTAYINAAIPTAAEPNNLIALYWDDMNPSGNYYGEYYTYQDAVNGRFIVEFDSLNFYVATDRDYVTCQAIFYDDGTIDFQYKAVEPGSLAVFPSATVGIENASGTAGLQLTFNGSGPWEPVSQSGVRIHPVGILPVNDVDVTLTPYGAPIVIPAGGGSFDFNIQLDNNELIQVSCGVWTMLTHPNGVYGPIINVAGFPFAAGGTIERDRSQAIPAGAPTGAYAYDAYAGIYPSVIWGEDHFDFTKSADFGGFDFGGWYNWGEAFPGEIINAPLEMPVSFSLSEAYPNPFNPVAKIGYSLPERSQVELVVYDVTGRVVQSLINGHLSPGKHEAVFDGSGLASGVYFYRLTAGEFSEVKKMVLVK